MHEARRNQNKQQQSVEINGRLDPKQMVEEEIFSARSRTGSNIVGGKSRKHRLPTQYDV